MNLRMSPAPVLDPIMSALADPTRRAVFEALTRRPSAVGELARDLPVTRPAVSQHLRVLLDAGLVTVRAEGTRRIYTAEPEGLAGLRRWLDGLWSSALQAFAAHVDAHPAQQEDTP
jgi:DNA-binding transcriptional ArsR family regulator